MIRRPPRSTLSSSSAASDVYKRQHSSCGCGREPERDKPAGERAGTLKHYVGCRAVTLYRVRRYREDPWCRINCHRDDSCRTIITSCRTNWYYSVGYCLWCIRRVDKVIGYHKSIRQSCSTRSETCHSSCGCGRELKCNKPAGERAGTLKHNVCCRAVTLYRVRRHREDPWCWVDCYHYYLDRVGCTPYWTYRYNRIGYCLWNISGIVQH